MEYCWDGQDECVEFLALLMVQIGPFSAQALSLQHNAENRAIWTITSANNLMLFDNLIIVSRPGRSQGPALQTPPSLIESVSE